MVNSHYIILDLVLRTLILAICRWITGVQGKTSVYHYLIFKGTAKCVRKGDRTGGKCSHPDFHKQSAVRQERFPTLLPPYPL